MDFNPPTSGGEVRHVTSDPKQGPTGITSVKAMLRQQSCDSQRPKPNRTKQLKWMP